MRKLFTTFSLLLVCTTLLLGQQKQFTGKVTDISGQPVGNASVKIKGTKTGTTAGLDGSFLINANTGDVLEISAVGLGMLTHKLGSSADIGTLTMNLNETAME
ncbi:MAG TPA: carboxypeptidase-like regulatory domain-containing protein, partial [Chitinophagaceae bacterium]|nr:carboxypeptidase-like regulatory domain-containing protein [Chitinophagaceae bacterium]